MTREKFYYDDDGKFTQYAWPGGYPTYLVMSDGESLCIGCARKEQELIEGALPGDNWHATGMDINYEDDLRCCHCSEPIESAYE